MDFLLESTNADEIRECLAYYPLAGISSNPGLIRKEEPESFFACFESLKSLIGSKRILHVQVTADNAEEMLREANELQHRLGADIAVKVPVNREGLRAIRMMSKSGIHVTATAIYGTLQGFLAIDAGAEYIDPFFNAMVNLDINAAETISSLRRFVDRDGYECRIMVSAFKSVAQINQAFSSGADAVSVQPIMLAQALDNVGIDAMVQRFREDWQAIYGERRIYELE